MSAGDASHRTSGHKHSKVFNKKKAATQGGMATQSGAYLFIAHCCLITINETTLRDRCNTFSEVLKDETFSIQMECPTCKSKFYLLLCDTLNESVFYDIVGIVRNDRHLPIIRGDKSDHGNLRGILSGFGKRYALQQDMHPDDLRKEISKLKVEHEQAVARKTEYQPINNTEEIDSM